jgi:ectoine hydroxylase-related dioxygenase (phytanoyl-CoA dioxygenase family)
VLNVFIPLIDITDEEGPTEFRPQSQRLTLDLKTMYLKAFLTKTLQSPRKPHLKRGSILLVTSFLPSLPHSSEDSLFDDH